ncbi:thiosulfate sulfurtransferase/rhodanese-like domain-containing protein 3 [Anneissia japonica]|uniref:thiosulfate sulfurtransferase/rhodanese-like domain-containing protein 3 n=1 Tax=Anneissia japonica TaxID=1529436 RepID=UPI001425818B|nr:thiosulfate sulfurtransferase/rhodanese-like domain-containing protein 3 [Anneissia japonica]
MIGKAVWRLTCQQLSNKTGFVGLLSRPRSCGSAWPRLLSSSSTLQLEATESWPALCKVERLSRLYGLGNLTISRCYCTSQSPDSSEVPFEELENLVNAKKGQIVDVREPEELQTTGRIGKAMNIPVGEIGDALQMSEDAFNSKYGHKKPDSNQSDIVFYCLGGVRSKKALDTAHSLGYTKARHFKGGWMEWAEQNNLPLPE